jgi:hypothetical protein
MARRCGRQITEASATRRSTFCYLCGLIPRRWSALGRTKGGEQECLAAAPGKPPAFHIIELRLENRLMVEVATQDMLPDYIRWVRYDMLDAEFSDR